MQRFMTIRAAPVTAALLLLALLSGCSDESDGSTPEQVPASSTDYYQAYGAFDVSYTTNSLVLVDTADFTRRIDLGPVQNVQVLYTGVLTDGEVQYRRPHSAYFIQDGALHRVSLRHSGSQEPQRVSRADFSDGTCSGLRIMERVYGSANGAWILFSLPHETLGCDAPTYWRTAVDASAGASPSAGPIGTNFVEFRDSAGRLTSLLAFDYETPALRRYDGHFGNVETLGSGGSGPVNQFSVSKRSSEAMIVYDGALRRVSADGNLSAPLHPVPIFNYVFGRIHGEALYFNSSSQYFDSPEELHRVPLDGSAPAQLLWAAPEDTYSLWVVGFTDDSVVLFAQDSTGAHLLRLPRDADGSTAPEMLHDLGWANVNFYTYSAPFLYWSSDENGAVTAHRLDADEALTSLPGSEWIGLQYPLHAPLGIFASGSREIATGAFRADGVAPGQRHLGASLVAVALDTGATMPLFDIEEEVHVGLWSIGAVGMGTFAAPASPPQNLQYDVFSSDFSDGRVERHTNGTLSNEFAFTNRPYDF
jgi:hypothetical protein